MCLTGENAAEIRARAGNGAFFTELPIGFGYELKEIKAPEGYLRNTEDVYSCWFNYTNDKEAKVSFSHTFANECVKVAIRLQKKDKETNMNIPQGDAVLEHAVYVLYAKHDVLAHGEGIVKADVLHGEAVSGEGDRAVFGMGVPFGAYYICEQI